MTVPQLPTELLNKIFYEFKGIQTPTARIMNALINQETEIIESMFWEEKECHDCGHITDEATNSCVNEQCDYYGWDWDDEHREFIVQFLLQAAPFMPL